jgi:hypothetical protein
MAKNRTIAKPTSNGGSSHRRVAAVVLACGKLTAGKLIGADVEVLATDAQRRLMRGSRIGYSTSVTRLTTTKKNEKTRVSAMIGE